MKHIKLRLIYCVLALMLFDTTDSFAAINPRQDMEPDGRTRTFDLEVFNNTDRPITFTIQSVSCCDSPLSSDVYGSVAPGGRVTIWIARVQGNGCDGDPGRF